MYKIVLSNPILYIDKLLKSIIINITKPKVNIMDITPEQKELIRDTIVYKTSHKYFVYWAPRDLHNCYSLLLHNATMNKIDFNVHELSPDIICNALWNEMSYNPVRFGTISPFKFGGRNSLQDFCKTKIDPNIKSAKTLKKIQTNLKDFISITGKNHFQYSTITITLKRQTLPQNPFEKYEQPKPKTNVGYKMLAILVDCVHKIASQNLQDLDKKTFFEPMYDVILSRHPNLIRTSNFIHKPAVKKKFKPEESSQSKLKRYLKLETKLEKSISKKSAEMSIIQANIDSLSNDFENPADTQIEQTHLNKLGTIVTNMEEKLKSIRQKIAILKAEQHVM